MAMRGSGVMESTVFGSDNNYPSATVTQYNFINATQTSSWTTIANRMSLTPVAGTISNFYLELDTAPGGSAAWTFNVMKNGSTSGVTVTISGSSTSASDNTHTAAYSPGDVIELQAVPSTTPTLGTNMFWNMNFTSTSGNNAPIMLSSNTGASTTVVNYFPVVGGINSSSALSANQANEAVIVPTSGTLSNLYVQHVTVPGAGNSFVYVLFQNGIATAITATISGTNATANDLTHSIAVTAGDTLSWQATPTGTPTASGMLLSMSWAPTNNGETWIGYTGIASPSSSATQYDQPLGIGNNGWNTTETLRQIEPGATTITAIYTLVITAPGGATARTVNVRQNASSPGLAATITGSATTSNSTGSVSFAQSDRLSAQSTVTGSPAATAGLHISMLLYIAPAVTANTAFFNFI